MLTRLTRAMLVPLWRPSAADMQEDLKQLPCMNSKQQPCDVPVMQRLAEEVHMRMTALTYEPSEEPQQYEDAGLAEPPLPPPPPPLPPPQNRGWLRGRSPARTRQRPQTAKRPRSAHSLPPPRRLRQQQVGLSAVDCCWRGTLTDMCKHKVSQVAEATCGFATRRDQAGIHHVMAPKGCCW